MRLILVAAALTAFGAGVSAQGIYKHTDPSGRVTYSDDPAAGNGTVQRVEASLDRTGVVPRGYGSVAMAFHWLTAVLVLAAFVMGPGGSEQQAYSAAKDFDRQIHEILGLMVFGLTLLRLAWRAFAPPLQLPAAPRWMNRISRIVRGLLYGVLVATPVTAIAGAWLEGHPLTLGILGNVAPMVPEAHAAGQALAKIHTILGDSVVWLAGFHAAAALFHHFALRDEVLLSMLPPRWRRRLPEV
jgi:cytochrome b561